MKAYGEKPVERFERQSGIRIIAYRKSTNRPQYTEFSSSCTTY